MRRRWILLDPHITQWECEGRLVLCPSDFRRDEDVERFVVTLLGDLAFRVDRRALVAEALDDIRQPETLIRLPRTVMTAPRCNASE